MRPTLPTSGLLLLLLASVADLANAASVTGRHDQHRDQPSCGYQSCTKSDAGKINIHLVAHTHDDVGWLKTVDQYYFGGRMNIQVAGVQYIIDSVVDALVKEPSRKFIYAETAFLWKWWLRQDEAKRATVRNLVDEGRLEIVGGGWSMNDEATTHYQSMIDQFTWGFRRLNDSFGECARPRVGWQIDPFGHSREQASVFAQLGFDGLLFGRLDHQDKRQRLRDRSMEFVWRASPSLGQSADLFTSVLYNTYSPPPGFCFDILCQDAEPMIDDRDSPDYNIDKRVQQFLNFSRTQASIYRTNNVILTMGEDFHYQYADMYFGNIDKLISAINKLNGTRYKAFYSTPSCYLKAVNERNLSWPTKSDDFFPYSSDPHAFWTGYFTSRPTLKYFERMANNLLQVVKQLSVLSGAPDSPELQRFREAMGVMQHHDAVTGTEKQHVADDYARILHRSVNDGERLAGEALRNWTSKGTASGEPCPPVQFHSCLLLNVSSCEHSSDHSSFVATVYNPGSQPLNVYVRLPVAGTQFSVKDFSGKEIVSQVVPIPAQLSKLPGRSSSATRELVFQAVNVAALGYQSFHVSAKPSPQDAHEAPQSDQQSILQIGRQEYGISVSADNRVIVKTPLGIEYEQSFQYYEAAHGNNEEFVNRSSGAYIFRPQGNRSKELPATGGFQIFKGPLVEEIHLTVNDWVSQVVRVYNEEEFVEFEWLVGPIPVDDAVGKEVVVKYASNLSNRGEFYTDSNGREMMMRRRNQRPSWKVELEEEIAGNYYPVTAKISIEEERSQRRLSVLNDRAQGGSSLRDGELELMVHRRLLHDDAFGVAEALNETAFGQGLVARGRHVLIAGSARGRDQLPLREKEQAGQLALRPWIFVTPVADSFEQWSQRHHMRGDGLVGAVPGNVRILTLEPWRDDQVLLRLEHLFERDESPKYSVPARLDINDLFPAFNVLSVLETSLGANRRAKDDGRLLWEAEQQDELPELDAEAPAVSRDTCTVSLKPMQIRTFLLKLSPRHQLGPSAIANAGD
ncbi:lysosomal alpha-mannosidase-like isoform X2 [Phymastichus coffea]|uniref:lysosomal alpha-mannosidase-like isoform X2 n=1 Tax=Phymastichus coffea TaxID=108790 RepID=UPI00273B1882|nr:lysosomal alpha-mannosidase-like isoform X2 [Phymastichus coffea]